MISLLLLNIIDQDVEVSRSEGADVTEAFQCQSSTLQLGCQLCDLGLQLLNSRL